MSIEGELALLLGALSLVLGWLIVLYIDGEVL